MRASVCILLLALTLAGTAPAREQYVGPFRLGDTRQFVLQRLKNTPFEDEIGRNEVEFINTGGVAFWLDYGRVVRIGGMKSVQYRGRTIQLGDTHQACLATLGKPQRAIARPANQCLSAARFLIYSNKTTELTVSFHESYDRSPRAWIVGSLWIEETGATARLERLLHGDF